ncbi:CD276 antigen-like [Polypterus senegalus]|uniref:CD276 antigen-like n=1 Tax=Polypterus senegalus TaxID=55291 RepID=UPI00196415F9|nr:CD276 antigen-like [Polypterus senegalus]
MYKNLKTGQVIWIVLWILELTSCEFTVTIPKSLQVAELGQDVVMACSFTMNGDLDIKNIIITWQRGEEVVHSFYYGQDQLHTQSRSYTSRTSLYVSNIIKGNASLMLKSVSAVDRGDYTCSVSTSIGSQKKTFLLVIAAFYTEPVMQIKVLPQTVAFSFYSEGYPNSTIQWLSEDGLDMTNLTDSSYTEKDNGLLSVKSTLMTKRNLNTSFTFILQNCVLEQKIIRTFSLISDNAPSKDYDGSCKNNLLLLVPICFFVSVTALAYVLMRKHIDTSTSVPTLNQLLP